MNYNTYKCDFNKQTCLKKTSKLLCDEITNRLLIVRDEIINEYKIKQKGRLGIRTLGNEIRYNKRIQAQFINDKEENVLLKITEHHRSFLYFFINALAKYPDRDIYFLILSRDFGLESNLVDKSFPDIDYIEHQLDKLMMNFNKIENSRNIFFVELTSFNNFIFEENGNYVKIHKI